MGVTRDGGSGRKVLLALLVAGAVSYGFWSYLDAARRRLERGGDNLAAEAKEFLEERNVQPLKAPLETIVEAPKSSFVPSQAHPLLGKAVPDFELLDSEGRAWRLSELQREGPVLLIFYYGYFCSHCVSQLFAVHEDIARFRELGARVIAVSPDPPATTRERFKTYGAFAFPVLSDPGNRIAALYGAYAPAKAGGKEQLLHGSFVLGKDGVATWCATGELPFTDNATLLHELSRLRRP